MTRDYKYSTALQRHAVIVHSTLRTHLSHPTNLHGLIQTLDGLLSSDFVQRQIELYTQSACMLEDEPVL